MLHNVTVLFDDIKNEIIFEDEQWFHHLECELLIKPWTTEFYLSILGSLICVVFVGLMSGLTVGLMSFEEKNLSLVMQSSKDPTTRAHAARVFMLVKDHHFLLVTLLLWNAASFETLPIMLDRVVPSYVAVILSVTFILIFGEVLPQAICTGPKRLAIGAKAYYLVRGLQLTIFPLAWVIAKLLDCVLGHARDTDDSVFVYLPEDVLGLPMQPGSNRLALLEVIGMSENLPPRPSDDDDKRARRTERFTTLVGDAHARGGPTRPATHAHAAAALAGTSPPADEFDRLAHSRSPPVAAQSRAHASSFNVMTSFSMMALSLDDDDNISGDERTPFF